MKRSIVYLRLGILPERPTGVNLGSRSSEQSAAGAGAGTTVLGIKESTAANRYIRALERLRGILSLAGLGGN